MKFVDEAVIWVAGGRGGDGCASLRREKYIAFGGPDGGDGGKGGDVYLVGDHNMNTLVDFRYNRKYRAQNGESGRGKQQTGHGGDDIEIKVPVGTLVRDKDTDEVIGDIVRDQQRLLVAKGGERGIGNLHFRSSTNRTPRQSTPGKPGENRTLSLELQVLADVGLLGMPNAGKSTLIRAISAAKPKVANYPFTTLHPNLGVVARTGEQSVVVADIPGLIPGAAEGHGLGIGFLKHVQRVNLLLHLVDVAPMDGTSPAEAVTQILNELKRYDTALLDKPRWLVLNKVDLLPTDEAQAHCQAILDELKWDGKVFEISAISKEGTQALADALIEYIKQPQ